MYKSFKYMVALSYLRSYYSAAFMLSMPTEKMINLL